MTAKQSPTNKDLYTALGRLEEKVDQIHEQTKKTNGRVTRLEGIESNRAAVEDYIDKEGVKTPAEEKDGWTSREKQLITIIMTILGIASVIASGLLK